MIFANPNYLWLLLLIIPIVAWYLMRYKKANPSLLVSTTLQFDKLPTSWKVYVKHLNFALRMVAVALLVVILARPQTTDSWQTSETEGTDIIMALDISTSMATLDFKPNRFEAAKEVASQFIVGRETDNIGMVIFAGESFTLVPMTTDKPVLINYLNDVKMGMIEDGTAIGDGLATAINRIKDGKAESKSIILLTDGSNNTGIVAPLTAAQIAKEYGIKVYTVGVGKNGEALYPVGVNFFGKMEYQSVPVVIDEKTLQSIASTTGGKYFRATNKDVLKDIFAEIDRLEKTVIDTKDFSKTEDDYMPWAIMLLIVVMAEIILRNTVLREMP